MPCNPRTQEAEDRESEASLATSQNDTSKKKKNPKQQQKKKQPEVHVLQYYNCKSKPKAIFQSIRFQYNIAKDLNSLSALL